MLKDLVLDAVAHWLVDEVGHWSGSVGQFLDSGGTNH